MQIVNFVDLKSNLKYWFKKITNEAISIIIKRKNKEDLILITLNEYNSLRETIYLLSGENGNILLDSIKELEENKGVIKKLVEYKS